MSAFKDNLEEQRQRSKYQKEHFWAILILSFILGSIFLLFLGFSEVHWIGILFYVPNFGETSTFYLLGLLFMFGLRWWWYGIPTYVLYVVNKIGFVLSRVEGFLNRFHFFVGFTKSISSFLKNTVFSEKIVKGRSEQLVDFFYPKTIISDELPRVTSFKYFKTKIFHIGNIFDYDALAMISDKDGTNRIIALFRDKKTEQLKKRTKSSEPKVSEKALEILHRKNAKYHNVGVPTSTQELEYRDLFSVIEGVLRGYDGISDSIRVVDFDTPLKLKIENKRIVDFFVDTKIDVFQKGLICFSLRMIVLTVMRMTTIYVQTLQTHIQRQSRYVRGRLGLVLSQEGTLQKFEDFFKIVFLRRLLLNYGSVPSGWLCVRIENYDLRAIISAVDRPLIPNITSVNDGTNDSFSSDVTASAFLFTYWAFFREEQISFIMEELDWCFNTTKDFNEIKARELSASYTE